MHFISKISISTYRALVALFVVFISLSSFGQSDTLIGLSTVDTTVVEKPNSFKAKWNMEPHSPLRATVYSAVIPGTGQIYNKKWWKSLIVYAGMGTCVYFISDNNKNYQLYKTAYIASVDNDPTTVPSIEGNSAFFNQWQEQYHRWRDVSYMALFGVYVLQIIDANVDGHLFYYDVTPDISVNIHPSFSTSDRVRPGLGLLINF